MALAAAKLKFMELRPLGEYEPAPRPPRRPNNGGNDRLIVHVPKVLPELNPRAASTLLGILRELNSSPQQQRQQDDERDGS
ncbi:hypothetical protein ACFWQL_22555 [Amycolatopsis thermoflava]|uniref:hypothetical protein n=1 Tax=Amycolatopsis thermoflava TaxID=84480 RepID=UPI003652AD6E